MTKEQDMLEGNLQACQQRIAKLRYSVDKNQRLFSMTALVIVPATYRGAPHTSPEWPIRGTQCRGRRRGSATLGCGASSIVPTRGRACSRHIAGAVPRAWRGRNGDQRPAVYCPKEKIMVKHEIIDMVLQLKAAERY